MLDQIYPLIVYKVVGMVTSNMTHLVDSYSMSLEWNSILSTVSTQIREL